MQQSPEFNTTNHPKSLIISKKGKEKLSKNQEAFNKLTKRIEKLQNDIIKKEGQLDLAMKLYGTDLYAFKINLTAHRREIIIALWDNYITKKLAKADQQKLKQIIRQYMQLLLVELGAIEPDAEIKKIFKVLEGDSYDDLLEAEKIIARNDMVDELNKMKADLTGIDLDDEEQLARKIYETRQKFSNEDYVSENNQYNNSHKNNKSVKQLEAELLQQEELALKQKNIGTIYKQLAKLFHPDLEQDEERKAEKEILMKELTVAYEAKNLHALLTLELRWIHKENEHLETLTEEKLAVYLQILKEQAQDLEYEKEAIFRHPQYAVLLQEFGWGVKSYPVKTVQKSIDEIKDRVENFKNNIIDLKSNFALRHIKQMIKYWREMEEEQDDY